MKRLTVLALTAMLCSLSSSAQSSQQQGAELITLISDGEVIAQLNLNDEQEALIDHMRQTYRELATRLRGLPEGPRTQKLRELTHSIDDQLRVLLEEDQLQRLDEIRKRIRTARYGPAGSPQHVAIHLTHSTDNLHAALMAIELGEALQNQGARVTLVLDLEGVRLADRRQPIAMGWGPGGSQIAEHYEGLVAGGARVILCPHCSRAAGVEDGQLRTGAAIAADVDELAAVLLVADKVLDY